MSQGKQTLAELRAEIGKLDESLLSILRQRMDTSIKIGTIKGEQGLPVKDFLVEKQVIDKTNALATQSGLNTEFVETCMRAIIEESVSLQLELQNRNTTTLPLSKKGVLVIGGDGNMGRWLCQFFASFGHDVAVFDTAPVTTSRYARATDLAVALQGAEIIVIATPLAATSETLKALLSHRPKGLIVEIASLKATLQTTFEEAHRQGCRVMSLHPMFGPSAVSLSGRNILICEAPFLDQGQEILELFKRTSANVHTIPFAQHDQLMSYALGAAHLSNLMFGEVLAQSGLAMKKLLQGAGTTFLNQLRVTQAVVDENKDLYFDIQDLNPETPQLLQGFASALESYKTALFTKNRKRFRDLMAKSQALMTPPRS